MGTESRRQELMKLCGLCDEALRELEAAAGSGGEDYEERIGLAAAMKQAGFSAEEIRERETALARVDYLLYQEERNG